ncbi:MAG: hypothetical protein H0U49_09675 [Parachlamydiaceae bacterium]|nr:hypothetical protein [Parachlamydiaceae bacterium]
MNILLFVTSLLMILSLLTYARIDNFRYFMGMQSEFERYMRSVERVYINKSAENWYETSRAKKKDPSGPQAPPGQALQKPNDPNKKPEPKDDDPNKPPTDEPIDPTKPLDSSGKTESSGIPTSRLSLRVLFNQKMRDANADSYLQTREWAIKLMKELYGKQKFFTDMLEENPEFLNEMLSYLEHFVSDLPDNERPKNAADLANLDIKDKENPFWKTFYLMLKGCPKEDLAIVVKPQEEKKARIFQPGEEDGSIEEDETDGAEEAIEYCSPLGYDSILNYISLRNTTKIRVYLASRELLTVIFGSSQAADEVINKRMALYRAVMQDTPPADASKQFQAAFSGLESEDSKSLLDFKVTKTNPSEYD